MSKILNNLSIRAKIIGGSFILLTMVAAGYGYALYTMSRIGNELQAIAEEDIPMANLVAEITEHQLKQSIHFERALRQGALLQENSGAATHFKTEVGEFDKNSAHVKEGIRKGMVQAQAAVSMANSEEDAAEFERVRHSLESIGKEHQGFEEHAHQVFALLEQGNSREVVGLMEKMEQDEKQLNSRIDALLSEIEQFTEEAGHKAAEHEQLAIRTLAVIALVTLLLGALVSWVVSRNIVKRLADTAQGLEVVASGDLTQVTEIDGNDEIGMLRQSMQTMRNRLLEIVSQITSTTAQLSTAAEQVSVVTAQTSANIQKQQSETEQAATAMNEMSATVQEVSSSISNTSDAAGRANVEAANGREVVEATVQAIQQLAGEVESAADAITQVEQYSENINTVLDVIKGIAEQTNLLALNAAIEAARAGEQGRGFAVVADEVRTLAGRTQESTAEINQIIEKLQTGSHDAVQAMNQSRERTQSVVEQAALAGESLGTIAESVSEINQMSTQIATAAEEQNAVAADMNRNIVQISDMATQNATGAGQTSAASQELAGMSTELQRVIGQFRV